MAKYEDLLLALETISVDAVVLDLEGTTTSREFMTTVLYPYAVDRMPNFVRRYRNEPGVEAILNDAREEGGVWNDEAVVVRMCQWMTADETNSPLKTMQGLIWEKGYKSGELVTQLYSDVAPALSAWQSLGLKLFIYSSVSERSQKLLYGHTVAGDLTPLLSGYFDAGSGDKHEVDSYRRIAEAIGIQPRRILFLSDTREALDAARRAGWQTNWLVREARPGLSASHRRVTRFDQISL